MKEILEYLQLIVDISVLNETKIRLIKEQKFELAADVLDEEKRLRLKLPTIGVVKDYIETVKAFVETKAQTIQTEKS